MSSELNSENGGLHFNASSPAKIDPMTAATEVEVTNGEAGEEKQDLPKDDPTGGSGRDFLKDTTYLLLLTYFKLTHHS